MPYKTKNNSRNGHKSERNHKYQSVSQQYSTVKLGNKERFDNKLIGIKELFPVTNLPSTSYE